MKTAYFLMILLLVTSTVVLGQASSKQGYFGVRVGYLRASTDLTSSRNDSRLGGVAPLNSFYGGVFYQHALSRWIAYRVEVNYQQKGIENQDQDGNKLFEQKFHYVGVTPLIGFTPLSGLGFFVGPEANYYFGESAFSKNAASVELGISGRIAYRYKWIGVEASYFKSFNEYTHLDLGNTRFGFKNQTWQVGLIFVPAMLKSAN
ncbi:MAG: PorT family protein [Stigonema ocellatum SAG 48.90 = DSM 106950]|nr:PorT family protein [Stigonema ocellatum SAG 48.90 = DSM 106950]